jgi:hypothetical protein
LRSLENQIKADAVWHLVVFGNLTLGVAAWFLRANAGALVAVAALAVAFSIFFIRLGWKSRRYLGQLKTRIESGT